MGGGGERKLWATLGQMTSLEPGGRGGRGGGEKWQARRQGGELPVDEALEDVGCYIKLN